ncbi:MAG: NADH:ubiquinone oxidoreductase [Planctomycetes bacterium]|nr:NADH:ubiquinone oxidoreductase [Planctomycetota bacterium]MBL7145532.1 NADH:ubiquinone oxidoreductase [Phycisphaerae bacterium]
MSKPKVGIYGLTGCAGDQLVILNCEDELLNIVGALDIKSFSMAVSESDDDCLLDIVFVEGTVVQPRDEEMLQNLRERAKLLIAIGTCAVWGGLPAMKNEFSQEEIKKKVYGPAGDIFKTTAPQPLSSFVKVDLSISGCPIEKEQLLQAVASLLHGDLPRLPGYAVCTECKMSEYTCLLVEKGQLCLGPITVAGCKARCPGYGQPCIGCRGPVEEANVSSEIEVLKEKGFTWVDIQNRLRTFVASIDPLQIESV